VPANTETFLHEAFSLAEGGSIPSATSISACPKELRGTVNIRIIFQVEIIGSLVLFGTWYWAPRLARYSLADALIPLLLLHLTRTLGLTVLVPTVVDPSLPRDFAMPAGYGDLIAAGLALLSIVALKTRCRFASAVVWIFSLEGIADLVNDFVQGSRIELPRFHLGVAWYIFTSLAPALLVTHFMIAARLVRHARQRNAEGVAVTGPRAG
jgi:hypothetical protein